MSRRKKPVSVAIGEQPFTCTVCRSPWFWPRDVHLTSGKELAGWSNPSATGLVCAGCGYLHMFYNDNLHMWEPETP